MDTETVALTTVAAHHTIDHIDRFVSRGDRVTFVAHVDLGFGPFAEIAGWIDVATGTAWLTWPTQYISFC